MIKICKYCQFDSLDGTLKSYKQDSMLFMENKTLSFVYLISEGYIKMVKYLENGDEKIIGVLGPGDYVSLLACLQEKISYPANAVALTEITVKEIHKEEVIKTYQKNDQFKHTCFQCAVTRSNLFQEYLIQSANIDVNERILNALQGLFDKFGTVNRSQRLLQLPFSKTVLANLIGIRRETLSRHLSELQEKKILSINKNEYILHFVT